ncbi:DotA/TraY family protein [Aureimonas populi]|uniref:DotA/TraY family protein n=1 Tax=Aureimonas populi TaxID=1701758 RepID=A0ABW5CHU4_9HYPH|nr:DotA/TraY family protein [Aureimonas populi]
MALPFPDLLSNPPDTDIAWSVVTAIIPMSGEATAFSVGIGVLASALTFLAVCWLAWFWLSGLTQAAYSGRPFGDGIHGFWGPLRVVLAFGMLVPLSGGLPAVSYVLRDLVARPAINTANAVAQSSTAYVVRDGNTLSPLSIGGASLVREVFESEVCAAAILAGRANLADTSAAAASLPNPAGSPVVRPARESFWPWGESTPAATTGYSWSWGPACGSLSVSAASEFGDGTFGEARRRAIGEIVAGVRAQEFVQRLAEAVRGVGVDPAPPSEDMIEAAKAHGQLPADLATTIARAGADLDRTLSVAATEVARRSGAASTMRGEVLRDVQERGFMALASYYRVLAHVSLSTAEAAGERPVRVKPDPAAFGVYDGEASRALAYVGTQFRREAAAKVLADGEIGEATAEASGVFADLVSTVTDPIRDHLLSYDGPRADPIADMMDMGSRLIVGAKAGYAVALAAYGTSALFMGAGQGALDAIMVPGWPILGVFFLVGLVLTYVLPLVPYVLMWFAFGAFVLEFAVASIAVLVWAFVHVRPDGQTFVSEAQRHGYGQLLIGIFFRLPATVLAFIAAHMLVVVLLNAFLASYNLSVQGANIGRATGLAGIVVAFAVMVYMQWQFVVWTFRLILSVPEKLGAWFGVSVASWGEGEAGSTVVGGVWSSQRNIPGAPKPGGSKGSAPGESVRAKGGRPLGAKPGPKEG